MEDNSPQDSTYKSASGNSSDHEITHKNIKSVLLIFLIIGLVGITGSLLIKNENIWNTNFNEDKRVIKTNNSVDIRVVVRCGNSLLDEASVELYSDDYVKSQRKLIYQSQTDENGIAKLKVPPGSYGFWIRSMNISDPCGYTGPTLYEFSKDQDLEIVMELFD